ncbi:MAG: DNA helicase II, partial [Candidatus Nitrotoga sp.]
RARRRLYLTFAQSRMLHGQVNYNLMSSFLRELPEELLHWITPRITARNNFGSSGYSSSLAPTSPIHMKGLGGEKSIAAQNSPWHISQAVHHAKFGEGVIVNIEGGDSDMRVQVNFRTAGTKWLALEYAKLTPL